MVGDREAGLWPLLLDLRRDRRRSPPSAGHWPATSAQRRRRRSRTTDRDHDGLLVHNTSSYLLMARSETAARWEASPLARVPFANTRRI
jgi:hypothetical protein